MVVAQDWRDTCLLLAAREKANGVGTSRKGNHALLHSMRLVLHMLVASAIRKQCLAGRDILAGAANVDRTSHYPSFRASSNAFRTTMPARLDALCTALSLKGSYIAAAYP